MSSFPPNARQAIFWCVHVFKTKLRSKRGLYQDSSDLNLDLGKQKSNFPALYLVEHTPIKDTQINSRILLNFLSSLY